MPGGRGEWLLGGTRRSGAILGGVSAAAAETPLEGPVRYAQHQEQEEGGGGKDCPQSGNEQQVSAVEAQARKVGQPESVDGAGAKVEHDQGQDGAGGGPPLHRVEIERGQRRRQQPSGGLGQGDRQRRPLSTQEQRRLSGVRQRQQELRRKQEPDHGVRRVQRRGGPGAMAVAAVIVIVVIVVSVILRRVLMLLPPPPPSSPSAVVSCRGCCCCCFIFCAQVEVEVDNQSGVEKQAAQGNAGKVQRAGGGAIDVFAAVVVVAVVATAAA